MAQITERISKSGEVSYLIRVSLGYEMSGKQITKSKTWRPEAGMNPKQIKKELNKVATLFEASFERREISRRVKFKDLAEEWFTLVTQTKELNVSTIEQMQSCKQRVYDAIGNRYVDDITYRQLQQFILSLSKDGANLHTGKGLAGKTQKHFITFISDVMNYAIKCEIIADNPCRNVTAVKSETKEKDIYSVDEVAAILDALDEKAPLHYHLLFHLLIFYGLRRAGAGIQRTSRFPPCLRDDRDHKQRNRHENRFGGTRSFSDQHDAEYLRSCRCGGQRQSS